MKLLHLYYDFMNLYGEYGNVAVLKKHLEDQGVLVELVKKTIGDDIDFLDYDFIYCGSGLESNLKIALSDLKKHQDSFLKAISENKVILFTGNAYEMLGEKIDEEDGLNIFDLKTRHTDKRISGDVVVKNDEFGEIVGFINKSTLIDSRDGLFEYVFKDEGLSDSLKQEGHKLNNLLATHIIGPILTKNPRLMEWVVKTLLEKEGKEYQKISYPYEEESYKATLNALKERQ